AAAAAAAAAAWAPVTGISTCLPNMLYFYLSFVISGLLSWNVDLTVCDLNKELQLFETRHTAQFSEQVKAFVIWETIGLCGTNGAEMSLVTVGGF
uniref:Microtubule-associated protein 1B/S N-terminal domain-containing protein n=1 Tax=Cynoglossus semilaevis TaxID=244447 RepID=A0A3P8VM47_CYNSE